MKFYILEYSQVTDLILLPDNVIDDLVAAAGLAGYAIVSGSRLLPARYAVYLLQVIQTNRHRKEFIFDYLAEGSMQIKDLYEIVKRQLMQLTFNEKNCFKEIEVISAGPLGTGFYLEYTRLFVNACKEKNSCFLYYR